jgi:hypothetical protein
MPSHSSHLLQPLDVGCFAVLKRAYSRFVSDLTRTGYNHIDKLDFLADYPRARLEAFQPNIVQTSFIATGIVPVDANRVLLSLIFLSERLHHHQADQAADQANSHQKRLEPLFS